MFGKGMEMMLINIIKSMGIDPTVLLAKFDELTTLAKDYMQSYDNKLASLDERMARIESLLTRDRESETQPQLEIVSDEPDSE